MSKVKKDRFKNRYHQLVEKIFFDRYVDGDLEVLFERLEINSAAKDLGIDLLLSFHNFLTLSLSPMPTKWASSSLR